MKDVTYYVNTNNWPTELEPAKEFARESISNWKWKDKKDQFISKIEEAETIPQLQEIVIYPILSGEGFAVIK